MRSRDYTKELGLAPITNRMPLPVTVAVLGVVVVLGALFVKQVHASGTHAAADAAAAAPVIASSH